MVSPWMELGNLNNYLELHNSKLRLEERLSLLRGTAGGLQYLHANSIVHGDLTGANILIGSDKQARLCDFGLSQVKSKVIANSLLTSTVSAAYRWLPPELFPAEDVVPDVRWFSDIYSFGCVMLQILSGRIPYWEIRNHTAVLLKLQRRQKPLRPPEIMNNTYWSFIQVCWADDPRERPVAEVVCREVHRFHSEVERQRGRPDIPTFSSSDPYQIPLQLRRTNAPRKGRRHQEVNLGDISPHDKIVLVMGLTGVGKSTFIDTATRQGVPIGHGLRSFTSDVRLIRCLHPDNSLSVVFVDTPGFDDTFHRDYMVLDKIASWLVAIYRRNVMLAGIIYLHRVSDNRIPASTLRNIRALEDMCGASAMRNVVLVTTMWNEVPTNVALQREREVEGYWSQMLQNGARTMRFRDSFRSAWEITDTILRLPPAPPLHMTIEQVHRNRPLHETLPGMTLKNAPSPTRGLKKKIQRLLSRLLRFKEEDPKAFF